MLFIMLPIQTLLIFTLLMLTMAPLPKRATELPVKTQPGNTQMAYLLSPDRVHSLLKRMIPIATRSPQQQECGAHPLEHHGSPLKIRLKRL